MNEDKGIGRCQRCGSAVFVRTGRKGSSVIKSRLVMTDDQGRVLAKCKQCGAAVPLPIIASSPRDL